ncbi:type I-C CRISPR-associated protein Cas5c [Endozoicomonas euniceicola]|uniref:pre-crRNA processing endonuclease n=1 Tax=Endozoicomonas euniceicola TaxID=1234143 RepID=A0ABY6GRY6_9GAMM|nr:type I-C CRISPR-associated protein Cas5c [Endozoicomonas euniceicola]UYM14906.1 type I-C CRISPR-associated protein Cas5c [Endozoicomonas euniceicola]
MTFCIEVSGEFACFTRPEMRVERVSYDVITPSAARNIYQAILWKPQMAWHIDRIEVLNPIRWMSIRRNEVGSVVSAENVRRAMRRGQGRLQMFVEDERQQRSSLVLRDVSYRIHAHFSLTEKAGSTDNAEKYLGMFLRRARKGQVFKQPYLGCREFAADIELIEPGHELSSSIDETRDLGWMFYDFDYSANPPSPRFFNARMEGGVINIPMAESDEVQG